MLGMIVAWIGGGFLVSALLVTNPAYDHFIVTKSLGWALFGAAVGTFPNLMKEKKARRSKPTLMDRMAHEVEAYPSRIEGMICLALSCLGLGVFILLITIAPTGEPYMSIVSALWTAIFGYLSYWFYSGRADPRFGHFRISLTAAVACGVLTFDELGNAEPQFWKATFLGVGTIICFVGALRSHR